MGNNKQVEVSENLQKEYNNFYNNDIEEWRNLGARAKSKNIIEVAGNDKFEKVIEIGAGDGAILEQINNTNFCKELYALEISDSGIQKIQERNLQKLRLVEKFDGYSTNFKDNEFDLAYCSHVIEHVEHPRLLLREIKRISKKQIFEVPIDFSFSVDKRANHFLSYGHINIYTPSLFRFLLISEGYKILEDKPQMLDVELERSLFKTKKRELSFISFQVFKFKTLLKRVVWKLLPKKMQDLKPQTYTVLTKDKN